MPWALVVACAPSCAPAVLSPVDPEHAQAVAALGLEDPSVPVGPLHRVGQPCALCHDSGAEAAPFAFAGTAYVDDVSQVPLTDAAVELIDSTGKQYMVQTNCVGNFYVAATSYQPTWPVWVTVSDVGNDTSMGSPVHRERSCAACHFDPAGPRTAGHVFLTSDDLFAQMVPVRPCRPDEGSY